VRNVSQLSLYDIATDFVLSDTSPSIIGRARAYTTFDQTVQKIFYSARCICSIFRPLMS